MELAIFWAFLHKLIWSMSGTPRWNVLQQKVSWCVTFHSSLVLGACFANNNSYKIFNNLKNIPLKIFVYVNCKALQSYFRIKMIYHIDILWITYFSSIFPQILGYF
jgi:hypothetical protein